MPALAADPTIRRQVMSAAREVLAADAGAPLAEIAERAGVSRATFYRHFRSRAELLAALDIQPDPDARERILAAAVELIGRDGLRGMSMDELATRAAVSRATVYRLFPGKEALFDALLVEYSPFAELEEVLERLGSRPPDEVLPALAQAVATVAGPRIGIIRSLFFEVSSQTPDALTGADPRLRQALNTVGRYLVDQMAAGTLRPMHPLLAAQAFMGPIVFHLVTRSEIERLGVLDVSIEQSVDELARTALRALGT
jgi:AcrR family transcriptional regulator